MRKCVLMLPVLGLLLAADKPKEDAKKALKKFQGSWVTVSVEVNGKPAPDEALKGLKVTIEGNMITIELGEITTKGTFTIDPAKMPKWLDSTGKTKGKEVKTVGIYEFDKGQLKICSTHKGGKRPTEFSTKDGTKEAPIMLAVYKKAKAD